MISSYSNDAIRRIVMWSTVCAIVLTPLLAMLVTDEVAWTSFDFLFAAVLLGGAGAMYEIVAWRTTNRLRRGLAAAAIVFVVALVWLDGAVGIL